MKSTGVVLCNPLGHEYYRSYRAYVKLADALANAGFPVLRFDYVGTGDSEGDASHAHLDDWLGDIADSVDDLKASERVSGIVLGGLRFGGTLALLSAERTPEVCGVILWDGIEDGAQYLEEQRALHAAMLSDLERFSSARSAADCMPTELVGASYARSFLDDIAGISISPSRTERMHVFVPTPSGNDRHATDYGWTDRSRIEESIVDPGAINSLVTNLNATLT